MGFSEPTPIQLRAFPIILAGKDLIGTAQTGTGKTAAFALPILTLLAEHGAFRCLVLEPTRELAAQVETAFRDYGRFTDLRVSVVHGGVGYGKQREEAARGIDIVCATPGRLLDLLEQRAMNFSRSTFSCSTKSTACSTWAFCPTCGGSSNRSRPTGRRLLFSATLAAGDRAARCLGLARTGSGRDRRAPFAGGDGDSRGLSGRGRAEIRSAHGFARADELRQRPDFFAGPNTAPIASRTS